MPGIDDQSLTHFPPEYPGPGYAAIYRKWKFAWCKQVIPVTYITLAFPVTFLGLQKKSIIQSIR
jgi:hypothetical protein